MSDPLTPEERELARLLGRPAASVAPGTRVDAGIAALAREATAMPPAPRLSAPPPAFTTSASRSRHGRRRGLVSSLAVAASLVLVVGLAWQLRPVPSPVPMAETASAPVAASPVPAQAAASDTAAPEPAAVHARRPAPPALGAPPPPAKGAASAPVRESAPVAMPPPAPAPPPIMPTSPPAPPAPAAYALEPASVATDEATAIQQPAPAAMRLRSAAPEPLAGAKVPSPASELHGRAAGATAGAAPAAVDEDARLPRRQWLERIRLHRDAGDLDIARASLERFMQTYPEARIPHDLRPLLED